MSGWDLINNILYFVGIRKLKFVVKRIEKSLLSLNIAGIGIRLQHRGEIRQNFADLDLLRADLLAAAAGNAGVGMLALIDGF